MMKWARSQWVWTVVGLLLAVWTPSVKAAVQVVDDAGRTVRLDAPARRVIALYGAFTEMLCAIGAEDILAARTQADAYPPQIRALPSVGTHMRPNVEMILGLQPDLVVQSASRRNATPELARLEEAGIPVVIFAPKDFEGVFRTMERLGVLVGRSEQAHTAVENLRGRLEVVRSICGAAPHRPRAVFEIRAQPLAVAGQGGMPQAVMDAVGAINAVTLPDPIVQTSVENLMALDPDVYLVQIGPMNPRPSHPRDRAHFDKLRAVISGRVFEVDEALYSRPGPRAVDAAEELARRLYPSLFP
ncbi:ABC transporter substrate-binding protein [Desulfosoma caldarium]|uniref:Iron complex transport system substrate-binding protein n=1 Tax=Desulfosoma caldarium TaxID=610254 RepID=A0A3N1VK39_9BACT|nr:helical backbone metal receptor [Desulfosoma caldarium]ROR03183.1 iron complex transport system substrate-binding protein [Desulfosoma caldarium]